MAESADSLQYHKVSQLLAYNEDSDLVFFVGQSLSKVNGETVVSEHDMLPNIFVLNRLEGSVQCVSCRLVTCHRAKNSPSASDRAAVCLGKCNADGTDHLASNMVVLSVQ